MAGFQEKQIALLVSKDRSPIPPFYPYEHTDASRSERKGGDILEGTPSSCGRGAFEWILKHIHPFQNMDERLHRSDFWGSIKNQ